ncbi:hypothetical protein [Paenirhodobacter sp.]|uniref:hypothetical protein n=1 Tax=Paenirhodobacter sp. TaxID=1965326 RepID=UPI003B41B15E
MTHFIVNGADTAPPGFVFLAHLSEYGARFFRPVPRWSKIHGHFVLGPGAECERVFTTDETRGF